jgi:rubrerythrin
MKEDSMTQQGQPSSDDPVFAALREAIMTEIKGQQLYSHAASQTQDPVAKGMFESLAHDEEFHVSMLQGQVETLTRTGRLDLSKVHPAEVDHGAGHIIDDDFRKALQRGTFEMAVISIGCDLENKAINYYRTKAQQTKSPELKQLFTWLVEWEVGHLSSLQKLEKSLQDEYWAERGFSPL